MIIVLSHPSSSSTGGAGSAQIDQTRPDGPIHVDEKRVNPRHGWLASLIFLGRARPADIGSGVGRYHGCSSNIVPIWITR